MLHDESTNGVVAGTLDSNLQQFRQALSDYRQELQKSEAAFSAWEARWRSRELEIDSHLEMIQTRLAPAAMQPELSLVTGDE